MTCTDVTELLRRVYPASLNALYNAVGRTRLGANFLSGLIDVAYFYRSIGGSPETLQRLLRFAFNLGRRTQGTAARRIPVAVIHVIDDLENIWGHIHPTAYRRLIEDMASQYTRFLGGVGVLRFLRQRGYRNILSLEVIASGSRRIYDIVLSTGRQLAVEVKSWSEWANATRSQWSGAGRQLARDLMQRTAGQGNNIIWIFYTAAEHVGGAVSATTGGRALRTQILNKLFDGIGASLLRHSRRRITYSQLISRLSRITDANIARNGTPLLRELLAGSGGIVANRDRLIQALRAMHDHPERFIFINPS